MTVDNIITVVVVAAAGRISSTFSIWIRGCQTAKRNTQKKETRHHCPPKRTVHAFTDTME